MLDNILTLPVDLLNNGTLSNQAFRRFDEYQNRTVYIGPSHTLDFKDTMTLYRTPPKPSGNFRGTAKTSIKFSKDSIILGRDGVDVIAPEIGEINFSLPVGTTSANALILRQRMIAALDHAFAVALTEQLEV